jgi:PAS domain S-box-containing protein
MSLFRPRTVRRTFALALWGTALLSFAMAGVGLASYQRLTLERRVRASVAPYRDFVSVGTDAAVAFEDPVRAQEILDALRANPEILAAELVLEDGRVLARFGAADAGGSRPGRDPGLYLGDDRAEVIQPLERGAILGVTLSLRQLQHDARQALWAFGAGVLVLLAVTLAELELLQRTVAGPLAKLTEAAERVGAGGDVGLRLPRSRIDEVARLGHSFEAMLHAVAEREDALRRLGQFHQTILDNAAHAIIATDAAGLVTSYNPAAARLLGYSAEEVVGRMSPLAWHDPEELARRAAQLSEELGEAVVTGKDALTARARRGLPDEREWTFLRKDGTRVPVLLGLAMLRDAEARFVGMLGVATDLTEQKRLADQLRQSQKLEGVGQLAGGIAHDFNNLLVVINSNAELVRETLAPDDPRRADLAEIVNAGARAAALTRQLLAFSRKQVLNPTVFSVNDAVSTVEKLLRRVIGEDVCVRVALAPDAGSVRADQVQIEQVVMNLVVNARDAMPHGGVVTLSTGRAELDEKYVAAHPDARAGGYACLVVSDTGVGMDEATRSRMFEPFFTTKAVGKGTGLGLSMVYGIVKQSGGHLEVSTAPGEGTTIRVYLPRAEPAEEIATCAAQPPVGGSETILLVEDEDAVRAIDERLLRRLGYRVLLAPTGEDALRVAAAHAGPIDLLATDVILPGIDGHELARRLAAQRGGLRVLYVTGYAGDKLASVRLDATWGELLQKPFRADELARAVRAALARPAVAAGLPSTRAVSDAPST